MTKTQILEDPYTDVGFLLWQIIKGWQRGRNKLLEEFGITVSQLEILSATCLLERTEQEVSQIAISNATNVDPMTTSTIIRNLEKRALLRRKASQLDSRIRIVELTDDGDALFRKAIVKMQNCDNEVLKHVDKELLVVQLSAFLNALNRTNKTNL